MIPTGNARINTAIDEILARTALFQMNDAIVFKSAERGAIMVSPNIQPNISDLPAARLWLNPTEFNMGANDFIVAGNVGDKNGISQLVDLDGIFYSVDKDKNGVPLDLQASLASVAEGLMDWFADAEDRPNYFAHSTNIWGFTRDQRVRASYGSIMRRFGGVHTLPPPWYTVTLTFSIDVYP